MATSAFLLHTSRRNPRFKLLFPRLFHFNVLYTNVPRFRARNPFLVMSSKKKRVGGSKEAANQALLLEAEAALAVSFIVRVVLAL